MFDDWAIPPQWGNTYGMISVSHVIMVVACLDECMANVGGLGEGTGGWGVPPNQLITIPMIVEMPINIHLSFGIWIDNLCCELVSGTCVIL